MHDENVNLVNGSRKNSQKSEATNGSQEDEGNSVVKGDVVGQSPPSTPPQKQQAGILKKSSPVNYKSSKL